ncbi:histone H1-like [Toxorhynchites rutilus septentrionalis]|uniref:histone H1-like n=1 Tax=Toxorhynchites rutilus septentrionalis TaxID=329112 RepID=UPI00247900A0|nr:histone H1-like [Toxorhynchites rutilus septentrionalis]
MAKTVTEVVKKPKKLATHPPVSEMVESAIKSMKERNGSSLYAIKKYIDTQYKCDVVKLSHFIKQSLKTGVLKGNLVQTKGIGASGSFKIKKQPKKPASERKPSAVAVVKKSKLTTEGKTATKKPASDKMVVRATKSKAARTMKSVDKKARTKASVTKSATKDETAKKATKQKSTKTSKFVVNKPKTPKPKKAVPTKKTMATKSLAKK